MERSDATGAWFVKATYCQAIRLSSLVNLLIPSFLPFKESFWVCLAGLAQLWRQRLLDCDYISQRNKITHTGRTREEMAML